MELTDKEIIEGLIRRDNFVTNKYFLVKYRPLFIKTANAIFDYKIDIDELINDLYLYLMKDDAEKLRSFEGRCTFGSWLKIVTIRFFNGLKKSDKVIEDVSKEPLYEKNVKENTFTMNNVTTTEAKHDVERLFKLMIDSHPKKREEYTRYVSVIRALVLDDKEPEHVAMFMGISVDNLYNIKKRAMLALAKVAVKEELI